MKNDLMTEKAAMAFVHMYGKSLWCDSYAPLQVAVERAPAAFGALIKAHDEVDAQNSPILSGYLAYCYYFGVGTKQDCERAREHSELSAQRGVALGQYVLGHYKYAQELNPEAAVELWKKAALQKHSEALLVLGRCYLEGQGVEKDIGEAITRYCSAARHGDAEAQYEFGLLYIYGRLQGQEQENPFRDYVLGAKNLCAAHTGGMKDALPALKELYSKLTMDKKLPGYFTFISANKGEDVESFLPKLFAFVTAADLARANTRDVDLLHLIT